MNAAPSLASSLNDLPTHIGEVAQHFWGEPSKSLSTSTELRWGKQGSKSVDLDNGVWFDHEEKVGGGVLDLIKREAKLSGRAAVDYMRERIGLKVGDERPEPSRPRKVVAAYDYVDENGEVLFQVVRYEPKDFRQRRPDPSGPDGWNWSAKGVRQVPYRLPELLAALSQDQAVCIAEGEKDVDTLWRLGVPATCNAGGAGKWPSSLSEHFHDADVTILSDNDDAGIAHRDLVAASLKGVAKVVRTVELPGLGPKQDVTDYVERLDVQTAGTHLRQLLATAVPIRAQAPKSRFGAILWSEVSFDRLNCRWLIKDLIGESHTGMVYGESGSGKSFLAVDAALSIARGVPFLGMKTTKGGVLYQAGEGGEGLQKRLLAYRQVNRVIGDLPFVLLPKRVNLFSEDGDADAFIEECVAYGRWLDEPLALVVIDTFSAASPGANENTSEDMGRMLDAGHRVNEATGAAILWVHHKNAGGMRERGHSSFRANVETVVEVNRDPESKERSLTLIKVKDGEDGLKLGFELQSVEIGTDNDGNQVTSCVVRPAQVGTQRTSTRSKLPKGQLEFLSMLDEAIRHHGGVLPVCNDIPANTLGVAWTVFRDMFKAVYGSFGRKDAALDTQLSRDGSTLRREGLIGKHDPWIWVTKQGERHLA